MDGRVATIRLNRPDRKTPLTFDSCAKLRDRFRALPQADDVDAVIFASNGGNLSSRCEVHGIIGQGRLEHGTRAGGPHCRRADVAHAITKTQINREWHMSLDQAIESEAQAPAICMQTRDFERAYRALVAKKGPVFVAD